MAGPPPVDPMWAPLCPHLGRGRRSVILLCVFNDFLIEVVVLLELCVQGINFTRCL